MIPQLLTNVVITSSTIAMVAVGFSVIYETARFFHFAHGAVFTLGAYLSFVLAGIGGMPLVMAFLISMGASAIIGCALFLGFYRPLMRRSGSPMVLLLVSLGLYVLLQNAFGLIFGDDTKSLRGKEIADTVEFLGARMTSIQVVIVLISVCLVMVTSYIVRRTKIGKTMRAVANDAELAAVSGVNSEHVLLAVFAVGSALAGAAGTLTALDIDMRPNMGLQPFMYGVVAVIIGGRGSISGIVLGALLLGLAQQLGGWWFGAEWQDSVAFAVLIAFLVARPRGFLGRDSRQARG